MIYLENQLFDVMPHLFSKYFPAVASSEPLPATGARKTALETSLTTPSYRSLKVDIVPESVHALGLADKPVTAPKPMTL